jgi:hypothetical protein
MMTTIVSNGAGGGGNQWQAQPQGSHRAHTQPQKELCERHFCVL